jgi:predicted dinucleotide-binding enzyme
VKKIVVVGTGRIGGAFAAAFAERTSHTVAIRPSHPSSATAAALSRQLGVRVAATKSFLRPMLSSSQRRRPCLTTWRLR